MRDLMKPAEVRLALKVSDRTLFRWAAAGQLVPIYLPGGQRRYDRAEVEAIGTPGDLAATRRPA